MSNLKKLVVGGATAVIAAAAGYGVKRLIMRLVASPTTTAAVPTPAEVAERLRLGRMSRKARNAERAARRAAEAYAH